MQAQILSAHLELIQLSLAARQSRAAREELATLLHAMHDDGWQALSHALRQRLGVSSGAQGHAQGDTSTMELDDEDRSILRLIDDALAQPEAFAALAAESAAANRRHAAQALAALVYAATQGEREALEALAELQQAADTPASVATSAALIHLVEGERNIDALNQNLPEEQAQLLQAVLSELAELEA
ncbi:MAG: hypothetical protein AB1717_01515 [Pseudomonadota bacterium]